MREASRESRADESGETAAAKIVRPWPASKLALPLASSLTRLGGRCSPMRSFTSGRPTARIGRGNAQHRPQLAGAVHDRAGRRAARREQRGPGGAGAAAGQRLQQRHRQRLRPGRRGRLPGPIRGDGPLRSAPAECSRAAGALAGSARACAASGFSLEGPPAPQLHRGGRAGLVLAGGRAAGRGRLLPAARPPRGHRGSRGAAPGAADRLQPPGPRRRPEPARRWPSTSSGWPRWCRTRTSPSPSRRSGARRRPAYPYADSTTRSAGSTTCSARRGWPGRRTTPPRAAVSAMPSPTRCCATSWSIALPDLSAAERDDIFNGTISRLLRW